MGRPRPAASVALFSPLALALVAGVAGRLASRGRASSSAAASGLQAGARGAADGADAESRKLGTFSLNADFRDLMTTFEKERRGDYEAYFFLRKAMGLIATADKVSILAFEDKLLLHMMVEHLAQKMADGGVCPNVRGIQQMPVYAWAQDRGHHSFQTAQPAHYPVWLAVDGGGFLGLYPQSKSGDHEEEDLPRRLVCKATHLANSESLKFYDRDATSRLSFYDHCKNHFHYYVSRNYEWGSTAVALSKEGMSDKRSSLHVSKAGAHVVPGCVLQAEYATLREREGNETADEMWNDWLGGASRPLELRAQVVWGRVHIVGLFNHGKLFVGFKRVVGPKRWYQTFAKTWPEAAVASVTGHLGKYVDIVSDQAECLARGLGVPWARIDFFVPPPGEHWPVVFNELEVMSGVSWVDPDDSVEYALEEEELVKAWDAGERAWNNTGNPVTPQEEILERFGCKAGAYQDLGDQRRRALIECGGRDLGTEGTSTRWFREFARPAA